MREQLRIYTINKGQLQQFVAEWNEKLRPLREKLGFRVVAAWTVPETNQFVWVQRYEGDKSWEEQDKAYFASEERRVMQPDPGRLIARMETYDAEPAL
ncbi:NIPSNAP family protein [Geomesophilobacter sediminis]|uniref:NIPSNAP family protein n=1 Tax=Geomesophilobacter sediminis TaxID=2798584 RepID=A0A8J7IZ97_9BACT|nr:NIPSNAP family protein [Geomesophilobacter sediminis]MBJ6723373.1 NIPSNAP family protein [Geomesophilobacter sediminis]